MVGNRFRWLNDGSSFVPGNNRLPLPVMLAWAKAKNEAMGKLSCGGMQDIPWPMRANQTPAEFPMQEFAEDGNFVVDMFCKVLGVGSNQVLDLSRLDVYAALAWSQEQRNLDILSPYDLRDEDWNPQPFFKDPHIMGMRMHTRTDVPEGEYQWFPFQTALQNRNAQALVAFHRKEIMELCGMWQENDGEFVLLFECLKPAKAARSSPLDLSHIELYCLLLKGAVDPHTKQFEPMHPMSRMPVGWADQTFEGFHLGPYLVQSGLYAEVSRMQGAQCVSLSHKARH